MVFTLNKSMQINAHCLVFFVLRGGVIWQILMKFLQTEVRFCLSS
jgi:hypothetical protein